MADKKRAAHEPPEDAGRPAKQQKTAENEAEASTAADWNEAELLSQETLRKIEANRLAAVARKARLAEERSPAPTSPPTPPKPSGLSKASTAPSTPSTTSSSAPKASPVKIAPAKSPSKPAGASGKITQFFTPRSGSDTPPASPAKPTSTPIKANGNSAKDSASGATTPTKASVAKSTPASPLEDLESFAYTTRTVNPSPSAQRRLAGPLSPPPKATQPKAAAARDEIDADAMDVDSHTSGKNDENPNSRREEKTALKFDLDGSGDVKMAGTSPDDSTEGLEGVRELLSRPPSSNQTKAVAAAAKQRFASAGTKTDETPDEKPTAGRPEWLVDPRDANKRKKGEPGFDPTSLYIPPAQFDKLTPAKKMYYAIKRKNFDAVVFFQQGSFFNLFGHDADISVQEFNWTYNSKLDSTGFAISAVEEWVAKFVALGYSVVVVEQKTTAVTEIEKKEKKSSGKKTEERQITHRVSYGTFRDLDKIGNDPLARFLLVVLEQSRGGDGGGASTFGICFVDVSTLEFGVGEIEDDAKSLGLETLLLQLQPVEVVFDRQATTAKTKRLFDLSSSRTKVKTMRAFPGTEGVAKEWLEKNSLPSDPTNADAALAALLDSPLFLRTFAATYQYLQEQLLLEEIRGRESFRRYNAASASGGGYAESKFLMLDAISLTNLELLENNDTKSPNGALLGELNHCVSPMGKRRLVRWVCHPLRRPEEINARQDAVEYLLPRFTTCDSVRQKLAKIKDVERLMSRVYACSATLTQFVQFLTGMERVEETRKAGREALGSQAKAPALVQELIAGGPDMEKFFEAFAIDKQTAIDNKRLTVPPGMLPAYDTALKAKDKAVEALEKLMKELKKELGTTAVSWAHSKNEKYLVEFATAPKGKVPEDFEKAAGVSKKARYSCERAQVLVQDLLEAERDMEALELGFLKTLQEKFAEYYAACSQVISQMADLDSLLSLVQYAHLASSERVMCRPTVTARKDGEGPFFAVKAMRHPYIKPEGGMFVANDVSLGHGGLARALLLTGPNMGGKSTLLRQVCIVVLMAQIGSYVPCESCAFTVVDRIFTRLGARDSIFAGKSTFFIEVDETAAILKHATTDSLVLLDELGRGTSTFDGYSLAYAVLKHLETQMCRVLFSTHYHKLNEEFAADTEIQQAWMACRVDGREIVPLFKLTKGSSSSSFGLEVAAKAQMPDEVLQRAEEMSANLQTLTAKRKAQKRAEQSKVLVELISALKGASGTADRTGAVVSLWHRLRKL